MKLPPELEAAFNGVNVQDWFNENVREQFKEHSGLNTTEIDEMLKNGTGPRIESADLTRIDGESGAEIDVNGKTEPRIVGRRVFDSNYISKDGVVGLIKLDETVLEVAEFTLGGEEIGGGFAGTVRGNQEANNRAFGALVSTVFHEAVHYGRFKTGAGNISESAKGEQAPTTDPVIQFEIDAYGVDVGRVQKSELKDE